MIRFFRIVKGDLPGKLRRSMLWNRSRQAKTTALLEAFVMPASDTSAAEEDVDDQPGMLN
jgi:hypothetical protein